MKLISKIFGLLWVASILAACAMPGSAAPTATVDGNMIITAAAATAYIRLTDIAGQATATPQVTPTDVVIPTATPVLLPTSIPTIVPVLGMVVGNANVRGVPSKSNAHDLGGLLKGQSVQVIGRNDAATWLYILYAASPTGTGWVISGAIKLTSEMGLLPILIFPNGEDAASIMLPPFIYKITGTPLAPGEPAAGWTKFGTLLQPANVRIGPSVGFLTIGILNPGQKVSFTGRTAENTWVQIDYPSGPGGRGWILATLVQANDGFSTLPLFDVLGTPVTPAPTTDPNAAPTAVASATPPPPAPAGAEATVTNQINVRSGPAQSYDSYGMLNPNDRVIVTGLTLNKYWYQIEYKASPSGVGWVAAQYVRVTGDMRQLHYFNNEGTQVP